MSTESDKFDKLFDSIMSEAKGIKNKTIFHT
jgi:hypothetical protein